MTDENPTDLQPGDRIEVLEYYLDGSRRTDWEGESTVLNSAAGLVRFRSPSGKTGTLLTGDKDRWRRLTTKPELTTANCKVRRVPPPQTSAPDASQEPPHACPPGHVWSKILGKCGTCLLEESARETGLPRELVQPWEDRIVSDVVADLVRQKRAKDRWPGADPSWIPHLEAKLAEQLKSGGYDCDAQRRLMVRAEKLVQEEHRDWCRKACSAEDYPGGLSQLRLPKPLIAYKRGR